MNYFCQLLNVRSVDDVTLAEMHTAEILLIPVFRPFEIETDTEKLRRYKSLGIDQISAELIQAGGTEIH
jgi:hypothetical protein